MVTLCGQYIVNVFLWYTCPLSTYNDISRVETYIFMILLALSLPLITYLSTRTSHIIIYIHIEIWSNNDYHKTPYINVCGYL